MLLVAICQRPHPKIPHGSRTLINCLSTSRHRNITKLDSSSNFGSCISFWEECILVNCGSCIISPGHLVTTRKRPNWKIPHGCLTILKCLSRCHLRKIMKVANSNTLQRHGLGNLATISKPFEIFAWSLLHIIKQTTGEIKNDKKRHTLFMKRNATLKKIMEFALVVNFL